MIRIVIDNALKSEFLRAQESCEVVDSAGNSLGRFTPTYAGRECPYTDEELRRIEEKGGGRPLKDILRDLENRA
ncbi:MAG: hypothetical protein AB7G28_24220 [Pirellulales bacterium]